MYLMVLDDGETYSELHGCRIIRIPDIWDAREVDETLAEIRRGNAELKSACVVTEFR